MLHKESKIRLVNDKEHYYYCDHYYCHIKKEKCTYFPIYYIWDTAQYLRIEPILLIRICNIPILRVPLLLDGYAYKSLMKHVYYAEHAIHNVSEH